MRTTVPKGEKLGSKVDDLEKQLNEFDKKHLRSGCDVHDAFMGMHHLMRDFFYFLKEEMMDKQIKKVKKGLDKAEKETGKLLKMDKKQDKKVAKMSKKKC